jgi:hypothetical protein
MGSRGLRVRCYNVCKWQVQCPANCLQGLKEGRSTPGNSTSDDPVVESAMWVLIQIASSVPYLTSLNNTEARCARLKRLGISCKFALSFE